MAGPTSSPATGGAGGAGYLNTGSPSLWGNPAEATCPWLTVQALDASGLQHRRHTTEVSLSLSLTSLPLPTPLSGDLLRLQAAILSMHFLEVAFALKALSTRGRGTICSLPDPKPVPWVCHPLGHTQVLPVPEHVVESPLVLLPRDQDKCAFLLKIIHFTKLIKYS